MKSSASESGPSIAVKNMLSIVSSIFTLFKVRADERNIGYNIQRILFFKLEKSTKRKILKLNIYYLVEKIMR